MNRKSLVLIPLSIILLSLLPMIPIRGQEWEFVERGVNFIRRRSLTTPGLYSWESAPQWVWDGIQYVPYIYTETANYYQIQSGIIGARIYKAGYAEFWNPEMTEVRLYEEMWQVKYYDGQWKVCDTYSPTFTVESNSKNINITASFITDWPNSGERAFQVKYIFREGEGLKHEAKFQSHTSSTYDFTIYQKWAGIVGDKVKHEDGENLITTTTVIDSPWYEFQKEDGALSIFENQLDVVQYLNPVAVDVHAQGMKADFIFSKWTLAPGENLELDPETSTLTPPLDDCWVSYFYKDNNYGSSSSLCVYWDYSMWEMCRWGYMKFDISTIPDNADISLAKLSIYLDNCGSGDKDGPSKIQKISDDSWSESTVTYNNPPSGGGSDIGFASVTEALEDTYINHTGTINEWVESNLGDNLVSFRISTVPNLDDNVWEWCSKEGANDPKLYIEYTTNHPPNSPSLGSPSASTRYDKGESVTFTWTFSDPDTQDTQGAYQIQIDDDQNFNNPEVDSGQISSSTESTNQNLPSIIDIFYWRVKTWDNGTTEGLWSTARSIIADRVKVGDLSADDDIVNVGDNSELTVSLEYEYDSTSITSGAFNLEGNPLTHQGGGTWTRIETRGIVTDQTYDSITGSVGNVNGVNMHGYSEVVIWDGLNVSEYVVDLTNNEISLKMIYAYDGMAIPDGNVYFVGKYELTNSSGWAVYDMSGMGNVSYGQTAYGIEDSYYDITYKSENQTLPYQQVKLTYIGIRSFSEIVGIDWNTTTKKLQLNATDTVVIFCGELGAPKTVKVNDATWENCSYSSSSKLLTILDLSSKVNIEWPLTPPKIKTGYIPNREQGDNCYIEKAYYSFTVEVEDTNEDVDKVYLRIVDTGMLRAEVRATDLTGTPVYSIQTGASIIQLDIVNCSWSEVGSLGVVVFEILFKEGCPEYQDLELAAYAMDTELAYDDWTVVQTNYFDIVSLGDGEEPEEEPDSGTTGTSDGGIFSFLASGSGVWTIVKPALGLLVIIGVAAAMVKVFYTAQQKKQNKIM